MRRKTSTQKINTAITNNMLYIIKAEKYNKTTHKTDVIAPDTFKESLEFLCESIFVDSIGWYYEKEHNTGQYLVECGRMDGSTDNIISAYLGEKDGISGEEIEGTLLLMEDD